MNKRQTEKHFKRIWQTALSQFINETVNTHIKPSRLKLHATQEAEKTKIVCHGGGYEFKLVLTERGTDGTNDTERLHCRLDGRPQGKKISCARLG